MGLLLLVSLIWAFSFGLIKDQLAGLDPSAVALWRLLFALLVFLPFLRWRKVPALMAGKLMLIGALQFGLMYVCYQRAFVYLNAYEVAVYTIFTPIYVILLDSILERTLRWHGVLAALLAVVGAAVIKWQGGHLGLGLGFVLVQVSNLCFAGGQLAYKRLHAGFAVAKLFGWLLAGAVLVAALACWLGNGCQDFHPQGKQWLVILYLGVLASGACFFWWNLGATKVNIDTLAVFNNAKIPAAVACALLVFQEHADIPRLLAGMALMLFAVWFAKGGA
jgi:drug/metabolite transporter (DMT)-like permease